MGIIEIENMEFHAFHGHFEQEQIVGNRYLVNLTIETDCSKAAESDELDDAINYVRAYELVKEEMMVPHKLLEKVTKQILDRLYSEFGSQIHHATIKVSKMNPPMGGPIERVSLTQSR